MPRIALAARVLFILLLLGGAAVAQNPITSEYDAAGRLVGVIDSTGNAAAYQYDATGNILSIKRYTSSQISLLTFAPISGAVSSTVTISGSGFSATPGQNTVKFNGTVATVTSATTTQLVASVPSGASTGTISVTSALGTATSSGPFTVNTASGAPTITGFSPNWAWFGSTLTINGTNFSTTAPLNNVQTNLALAKVSSATTTALSVTVPQNATSGRITVTTPNGKVVSSGDFFVPPVSGAGVSYTRRFNFGDTDTVNGSGGGAGIMIFDVAAGHKFSVVLSNATGWTCSFGG
jgi:YD repeat-containing protein